MDENDQILDESARADIPPDFSEPRFSWKEFFSNNKIVIGAAIGGLVIVGVAWFVLSRNGGPTQVSSENVVLLVKGPAQTTSGNEAEYKITYRNGENADLVSVSLELLYPSGFTFKSSSVSPVSAAGARFDLPILRQGGTGEVVVRGKLSGGTGEDKEIRGRLSYRLSNFNSEFTVAESVHTVILAPNVLMDISGPVDVVNGQDATFTMTLTNVTNQNFDNLAVELTYPSGYSFTSSNVPPAKNNNYWSIGSLPQNSSQSIEITGSFTGNNREEKMILANFGQLINNVFAPQISASASFRVIPSSLVLTITAQSQKTDYIKLGDTVNYKLEYANNGSIGLNNLIITVKLDSTTIDSARIQASGAVITGNTLTWKSATSSNLSVLSPNERGELTFSVPIKNNLTTNLKNQSLKVQATVTSDELTNPTRAADSELRLISSMDLAVSGDYVSGPVPLQVGQTTTFVITYLLSNLSNDLTGVEVTAAMPLPSSSWINVIVPDSEKSRLSFDGNSGRIRWRVGDLPAFVGKFIPVIPVSFQLAVTPQESDKGKVITLLSDIQAVGTDSFVNESIETDKIPTFTVNDLDDGALGNQGFVVQ